MPKSRTLKEADFKVRKSTIKGAGQGLFARTAISEEDTIGYYTGKLMSEKEFHREDRPFNAYVLWVCRTCIIDGEGAGSNYTRFINHSDEPNAFLVVSTRWKTARFEALRDIEPGEEIFFDYGEDYWE
ncbi:MAG: SET domain-containing protein-lysine N-methyltransferase [Verrucomicrobiota bacterium]